MKKRLGAVSAVVLLLMALLTLSAWASEAEVYFSADRNGQSRVTDIQEGDEVWIAVRDFDQNIDCDVRDKIWPDVKVFDPKTGAYIVWVTYSQDGDPGYIGVHGSTSMGDYLEETGADTGYFVSNRAFQVGTRDSFIDPIFGTHSLPWEDFQWGRFMYVDGVRGLFDCYGDFGFWECGYDPGPPPTPFEPEEPEGPDDPPVPVLQSMAKQVEFGCVGRFENMDSIIVMYQDPNEPRDVAVGMGKIIDTEASIAWDQTIYKDANGSAKITIVDPDENINCNKAEYVPVFIIVNPGSWNPVDAVPEQGFSGDSATNFCMLKAFGGVDPADGSVLYEPIRWFNIYNSDLFGPYPLNDQPRSEGAYYIEYATLDDGDVTWFDTIDPDGFARVMFYAQETGVSTGVFELNLNSLLVDLGFEQLDVRDVLVAYYLDPNDFDDFKLASAYIEERRHSLTSFTGEDRLEKDMYWLGRDSVYVTVIDANANVDPCCPEQVVVHICDPHGEDDSEWIVLDETSSNSEVFFSFSGYQLWPVWDALGVGLQGDPAGGYQLQLDNWKLEAFNEDSIYVRYNDMWYADEDMTLLGDLDTSTAFPPEIVRERYNNDISFDLMEIGDTQVFEGGKADMYFLDRQGNRVTGYVNSDCVFIEVVDPDQDENQYRRERIDGYWDGGQNMPFGPQAVNPFECVTVREDFHCVNHLLGDTNTFNDGDLPKIFVLNPRSGRWAAMDLLENGVATGDFVSLTCIELVDVYECVPSLDVLPGDTIVAFYQDPSNHSDSAMISIKVGIGGGVTPPSQKSMTMFVNADGADVASYTDADLVYVKVIDPSHTGAALLANAVQIAGVTYDLTLVTGDEFMTTGLDLDLEAGVSITATYVDPTDLLDTSSDTIPIVASVLEISAFYVGPNPFDGECTFGYTGTGVATVMYVEVYDVAGALVWASGEQFDVTEIVWDGAGLANGAYIYMIYATDGTNTFNPSNTPSATGKVFVNR